MNKSEIFNKILNNIKIDIKDTISYRYGEIGKSLNQKFRDTNSKTENTLQVGSYGRGTAIKGISDLDMLYIMTKSKLSKYDNGKQYNLLKDVRDQILNRYPSTKIKSDRNVVVVSFSNLEIEVVPVFEKNDGFLFPDTYNGASWAPTLTKPKQEIKAIKEFNDETNGNLKKLCRIIRAWKKKHGVNISGWLIDTLVYRFLKQYDYSNIVLSKYDRIIYDLLTFLCNIEKQDYFRVPGSNQQIEIKNKRHLKRKAKRTLEILEKALNETSESKYSQHLRDILGPCVPHIKQIENSSLEWDDTEEFIEDKFNINITEHLEIDCIVTQNGFTPKFLQELLSKNVSLHINKDLLFKIVDYTAFESYEVMWKVLNRGIEAKRKNCIRGIILNDEGKEQRKETTSFKGEHIVECYIIKNNTVVARDSILVPIQTN